MIGLGYTWCPGSSVCLSSSGEFLQLDKNYCKTLSQVIFEVANNEHGTSVGVSSTWAPVRWVFAFSSGVILHLGRKYGANYFGVFEVSKYE